MDNHFFQPPFPASSFNNSLIDSICGNQAVNYDWFLLTDPMTPILCLKITLWILKHIRVRIGE